MDAIDINGSMQIKLNAGFKNLIRPGETVYVSIIKKLAPDKWAVGILGKIFPARTKIELFSGDVVKAQVQIQRNTIYLKLLTEEKSFLNEKLSQSGINIDKLSLLITSSMLSAGLQLEASTIKKIKQIMEHLKKEEKGTASTLVRMLKKGISLDSPRVSELLDILNYGQGKRENKERQKKQNANTDISNVKRILKDCIKRSDGQPDNILPLFNHLQAEDENWIIVPYDLSPEGVNLKGTIRLLYDSYNKKIVKLIVIVSVNQGIKWSFYLNTALKSPCLSIFCNDDGAIKRGKAGIAQFRLKLNNNDVKIDDIIHRDDNFDGFSILDEVKYYQGIDTLK